MPQGNRAWCFTLNNPTEDETNLLPVPTDTKWPLLVQCVYQLEQGVQGTPHYQGYVRFSCQRSLGIVRRLLGRAHWEPARGTPSQNMEYCTKLDGRLGEPVIVGLFGGNIARGGSSLKRAEFVELIRQNPDLSNSEIIEQGGLDILCANPNLVGTIRGLILSDGRRDGVTCELYVGPAGTGKSRLADTLYPDAYRKVDGPWWDGYCGQRVVIFDDFDNAFAPIGNMLRAIDRYPLSVGVKGSFVNLVATHFVITSNLQPSEWYPDADARRKRALYRRITTVIDFKDNNTQTQHDGYRYLIMNDATQGRPYTLPWVEPDLPDPSPPWSEPSDLDPTDLLLNLSQPVALSQ